MKFKNDIKSFFALFTFIFLSCTNDDFEGINIVENRNETDLAVGEAQPRADVLTPGNGVLMQAFYWGVTDGGIWWDTINSKLDDWANAGVDAIWIPPISKARSGGGGLNMGYEPIDYFDFGDFEQNGNTETRFGNRAELESMITKAHDNNIAIIADMVINHNVGGQLEYNEFRQLETYTLFEPASGLFKRSQYDFHPNAMHLSDEGKFADFPDLDLLNPYVQDWMWKSEQSVANYYMNVLKVDGWRFDFVKGYSTEIVKDWMNTVGGYTIGENFDSNVADVVQPWVEATGANAFDFPNFFNMRSAFINSNLTNLTNASLFGSMPDKAVTFVGNHDTEARDGNNEFPDEFETHAYAFIMSAPGYPSVFYSHYEDSGDEQKQKIQQLISIRSQLAAGDWTVNHVDADEFIATRSGDGTKPGLVLYINISNSEVSRDVQTHWIDASVKDYTDQFFIFEKSDASGIVNVKAPANGYAIWAFTEEEQTPFPETLYVPGNYQGWNPAAAATLASVSIPNLDGLYVGHASLTEVANEFKFTDAPNWDNGIYGDSGDGISGEIASPGNNVTLAGPLDYEIKVDLVNNTWEANTWAIIGSATPNQWNNPDTDMSFDFTRNVWTVTANLTDGDLKFRANNSWDLNLGDTSADGSLEENGDNIVVSAGSYQIDLDVANSTFTVGNWGIIGSATPNDWNDPDTDMSYDSVNNVWTITVDLVPGEIKFRFNDSWDVNLGDTGADGSLDSGGDNIAVGTGGNYTITLDLINSTYNLTLN